MHLRSLTLKGFKSFAEKTRLEFAPGVSVVVGPNGSGKSNITDGILWVLGEQSPLTVRGHSMQDVIFSGGHGVQARSSAEIELVLDNGKQEVDLPFTEIAISRRISRDGEGEYRINGARCRLTDVLEILSDTGLGKEMHSVISQGRVEALVTSRPRDRRLLIEEAAGLGKHRKRRRQAQLKLERTENNLSRALDVEQEARSRLRPLKRQAEAAELHDRLERQTDEARWTLTRETVRVAQNSLSQAQTQVESAREASAKAEQELGEVAELRQEAENALSARSSQREELSNRYYSTKNAQERIGHRLEGSRRAEQEIAQRTARRRALIETLENERSNDTGDDGSAERIAALQAELAQLDQDREIQLQRELEELEARRAVAQENAEQQRLAAEAATTARKGSEEAAESARGAARQAQIEADKARREAAAIGSELAGVNQFLRAHAGAPGGANALADDVRADSGFELALAAVLGPLLRATVAGSIQEGEELLERCGADGGAALIRIAGASGKQSDGKPLLDRDGNTIGEPILNHVHQEGNPEVWELVQTLLSDVWVVDSLTGLKDDFVGVAVTRAGRVWSPRSHELRQVPAGGEDKVLAQRNRRDKLVKESEKAVRAEQAILNELERFATAISEAAAALVEAENAERLAIRASNEAAESVRHISWLMEQRRNAPDEGSTAQRRTQLTSALAAERRLAERTQRERQEREERIKRETIKLKNDQALAPKIHALSEALAEVVEAVSSYLNVVEAELQADREVGDRLAAQLRSHAALESQVQARLKERAEEVTRTEVHAQQLRDRAADATQTLVALAEKLGLEPVPSEEELPQEERRALEQRIERLLRRREQLGPVNPLAQDEYNEALEHVKELETQREDLETALRELRGLIRDTDKRIATAFEETFNAAAKNFAEVVPDLFPGGKGRLRLTSEKSSPESSDTDTEEADSQTDAAQVTDGDGLSSADSMSLHENTGIEIEITPAGKSTKRLSLLSGGEKAMTALAFMFAVFLARPCPFYVLDEVEAALDDLNLDRFLKLLQRFSGRTQFIVVTHQKRTMEVGDALYGVSMAGNGVSKVVSRKLPKRADAELEPGSGGSEDSGSKRIESPTDSKALEIINSSEQSTGEEVENSSNQETKTPEHSPIQRSGRFTPERLAGVSTADHQDSAAIDQTTNQEDGSSEEAVIDQESQAAEDDINNPDETNELQNKELNTVGIG